MADETPHAAPEGPQPNGADTAPQIGMIAQYVKDLSFESPNAPGIYQQQVQPQIDVQFHISVAPVADDVHEVSMKIEVRAQGDAGSTIFAVELVYAGLFGARNVEPEALSPFLYAEAPRLLFPFARRIVADVTRDGNFMPLLLDPIDFGAMYLQQAQAATQLAENEPAGQA
ncbi:MAG: protein-export chaperone SecB [Sphingomonas sp.]|nr:protein-export chaperone SecB [Sphingomonas sp.]